MTNLIFFSKKHFWLFFFGFSLVVFGIFAYISSPNLTEVTIFNPDGSTVRQDRSYYINSPNYSAVYTIKGKLYSNWYTQRKVRIVPDYCLKSFTINGKQVIKDNDKTMCLSEFGYDIDLTAYLYQGDNNVEMTVENDGGKYGVYFTNSFKDNTFLLLSALFFICLFSFFYEIYYYFFNKHRKFDKVIYVILILGILIRLFYVGYTRFDVRTHDVEGHLDYINYIVKNHALPNADDCYECHQKTVYYLISAGELVLLRAINISGTFSYKLLQITNILYFSVFLFVIYLIIKNIFLRKYVLYLSFLLLTFWPSGIIHSARITNDILFYLFYVFSLYFFYRYFRETKDKDFAIGTLFFAFAILTKITAISLWILLLGILIYKVFKEGTSVISSKVILLVISLLFFSFVSFIPYSIQGNGRSFASRITKSDQIGRELLVGNKPINYIFFDIRSFFVYPFASVWEDRMGRQYVINQFLKTSLYGEFYFDKQFLQRIVQAQSILLFLMIVIAGYSILFVKDKSKYFFILNALSLTTIFLIYRMRFPAANNTDFRYIYPIIIPLVYFIASAINGDWRKRNLFTIGISSIVGLYVVLSVIFFIRYPFLF